MRSVYEILHDTSISEKARRREYMELTKCSERTYYRVKKNYDIKPTRGLGTFDTFAFNVCNELLQNNTLTTSEKIAIFCNRTQKCKRTYFRIIRELNPSKRNRT